MESPSVFTFKEFSLKEADSLEFTGGSAGQESSIVTTMAQVATLAWVPSLAQALLCAVGAAKRKE